MIADKKYCMSSYLAFRFIKDENKNFFDRLSHKVYKSRDEKDLIPVKNADELDNEIKKIIEKIYIPKKTAVFLSGGMDSAILASYLPPGTKAYTFKCIAEGAIDETSTAKQYADINNLDHKIVEMHWSDFEKYTPLICKYNQVPFHSIEVLLYKACLQAKADGIEHIIIGESADLIFGGMDKLLSKDWSFDDFVERYTFTDPKKVLKNPVSVLDVYEKYRINDKIDFLKFMDEIFSVESSSSYMHIFEMANLSYTDPYSYMRMAEPLDLHRVRNGEPKYIIRELFAKKYPQIPVPNKIPMPRAVNQWLKDWKISPSSALYEEINPSLNTDELTGDQKWQLYCLDTYLSIFDKKDK